MSKGGRNVLQRATPSRGAPKHVRKSRADLTAAQDGLDCLAQISANLLTVAADSAAKNFVLLAFLVKALTSRVERVNGIQSGEHDNFPGDLTEGGLVCAGE